MLFALRADSLLGVEVSLAWPFYRCQVSTLTLDSGHQHQLPFRGNFLGLIVILTADWIHDKSTLGSPHM